MCGVLGVLIAPLLVCAVVPATQSEIACHAHQPAGAAIKGDDCCAQPLAALTQIRASKTEAPATIADPSASAHPAGSGAAELPALMALAAQSASPPIDPGPPDCFSFSILRV